MNTKIRQGDQITGATRGDREAIAHLAAIRSEEPGQRSQTDRDD